MEKENTNSGSVYVTVDGHGIKPHRYLCLSEVVYLPVKVHRPAFKGRELYPAAYARDVAGDKVRTVRNDSGDAG